VTSKEEHSKPIPPIFFRKPTKHYYRRFLLISFILQANFQPNIHLRRWDYSIICKKLYLFRKKNFQFLQNSHNSNPLIAVTFRHTKSISIFIQTSNISVILCHKENCRNPTIRVICLYIHPRIGSKLLIYKLL
jgi:hypothetical protein